MFGTETLGEYSDLYLKTNVLLLASIFENFQNKSKNIYDIDLFHDFSLPGVAFDSMFKLTGESLDTVCVNKF